MIDRHSLQVLEFDKIKKLVASYATSVLGEERIASATPSSDIDDLRGQLTLVAEFVDVVAFDDPVPMRGITDVRGALMKAKTAGSILEPEELVHLLELLQASRLLHAYFSKRKEKCPQLAGWASQIFFSPELEAELDRAIAPDGSVKDTASRRLAQIRRQIVRARSNLRGKLESIVTGLSPSVLQEDFVTIRDGRYVIPVREGQKNQVAGVIHDRSASGATVFIEPLATLELNNAIRELEIGEKREVERILRELTAGIGEVSREMGASVEVLGKLDATYAKALYARDYGACVPHLNEDGKTKIREGRHPILLQHYRAQPGKVVPLDIELGDAFSTLIITGPNAGGKTVALKTTGLLTLMVQSGFPVPADRDSELTIYDQIFADIGDEQSIESELSTFSSHVTHLARICERADHRTLVLLDEIGGSTDPEEGSALAMSILENLTKRGTRVVATTHHGALKAFVEELDEAENASMEFDLSSLEPTFKLRLGVPGSSYAFQIAKRLGLNEEIVADAAARTGKQSRQLDRVIGRLALQVQAYEEKSRNAELLRQEAERVARQYEEKLKHVKQEAREVRTQALEESKQIIRRANAVVEKAVADIKRQHATPDAIRAARDAIKEAALGIEHETASAAAPRRVKSEDVAAGDRVWVESLNQEGRVCGAKDSSGRVEVQVGSVKVRVSARELSRVEEPEPTVRESAGYSAEVPSLGAVSPQIDLRGMTFDEAAPVVDKYLDDLYLGRMEQATIIHGKGTGALREKIGRFLKDHPRVRSQRLGDWNEGGTGATIITLDLE